MAMRVIGAKRPEISDSSGDAGDVQLRTCEARIPDPDFETRVERRLEQADDSVAAERRFEEVAVSLLNCVH